MFGLMCLTHMQNTRRQMKKFKDLLIINVQSMFRSKRGLDWSRVGSLLRRTERLVEVQVFCRL